jgi:hypothetical protein
MLTLYFVSLALCLWITMDDWARELDFPLWALIAALCVSAIPVLNTLMAVYMIAKLAMAVGDTARLRRDARDLERELDDACIVRLAQFEREFG